MKSVVQMTRRSFIKAAAVAAGYAVLGFNLTREAVAAGLDFLSARQKGVYDTDANAKIYPVRKSQDNPMVRKIYDKKQGFLHDGPCGHQSHELLHTHYTDRSPAVKALKDKGTKLKV